MRRGEERVIQETHQTLPQAMANQPRNQQEATANPNPRAPVASKTDPFCVRRDSGSSKAREVVGEGLRRI